MCPRAADPGRGGPARPALSLPDWPAHIGGDEQAPLQRFEEAEEAEGPGEADARQGVPARDRSDRSGARGPAQSGDQPRRGRGGARRPACGRRPTICATAAPTSPPPTWRASRPRPASARCRSRPTATMPSCGASAVELARILGIEGDESEGGTPSPSPGGGGSTTATASRGRGGGDGQLAEPPLTPTRLAPLGDLPPPGGGGRRACGTPGTYTMHARSRRDPRRGGRRTRYPRTDAGRRRQAAHHSSCCCARAAPISSANAGTPRLWTPHRPPRPEKSEGGMPLQARHPTTSRPATSRTAIAELVDGRRRATSATRCCSASPARARPSPWPR